MDCSTPVLPVHHQLPEFTQTHFHWVDAIQSSHPLPSPSLFAFDLSHHQGLFNESALCIRGPKYWSFSFSISSSNEFSGLISFRIDWFDLPAVQGTLKSFLQHHSLKASILWCSACFMTTIQLAYLCMTTGKTTALTIQTIVLFLSLFFSCVWLFSNPWSVAPQAPLSMGFSRQEYWSELPFPSPGDLLDPGIEPRSPALEADALTSLPPGKPIAYLTPSQCWAQNRCSTFLFFKSNIC